MLVYNHRNSSMPKNVSIESVENIPSKAFSELYDAKDVIGNYAKSRSSFVRFYDTNDVKDTFEYLNNTKTKKSSLAIEVKQKNNPVSKVRYVNYESAEKPFLRTVYEALQTLCGDKSPIEKHVSDTRKRLELISKIFIKK